MKERKQTLLGKMLNRLLGLRRPAMVPVRVRKPQPRRGLTLVEMLVTLVITLLMMGAVVTVFANITSSVSDRRAQIELTSEMRTARMILQEDLVNATCPTLPRIQPAANIGYMELIEGTYSDRVASSLTDGDLTNGELDDLAPIPHVQDSSTPEEEDDALGFGNGPVLSGLGDFDDVLAFTTHNKKQVYVGQLNGQKVESHFAEIIWYAVENQPQPAVTPGVPGMRTIYRKVLLISPTANLKPLENLSQDIYRLNSPYEYYKVSDISAHFDIALGHWVPNTLGDLTKRENRFGRAPNSVFPFPMDVSPIRAPFTSTSSALVPYLVGGSSLVRDRAGEDIVLTNVLAFDMRVFDAAAPIYEYNGAHVKPGDPAWQDAASSGGTLQGHGAYVDLGYALSSNVSYFSGKPLPKSALSGYGYIFDTWPTHYENDGINQDNDADVDEGTDGIDNDLVNGVDDAGEAETEPPYNAPLRGIEVRIRTYEPSSRAIRETSVLQTFVPN